MILVDKQKDKGEDFDGKAVDSNVDMIVIVDFLLNRSSMDFGSEDLSFQKLNRAVDVMQLLEHFLDKRCCFAIVCIFGWKSELHDANLK